MIGKVEGFGSHLQQLSLPNLKCARQAQVQLKDARTLEVVRAEIAISAWSRGSERERVDPAVDALITRIRVGYQEIRALSCPLLPVQNAIHARDHSEKLGGFD